MSIEYRGSYRDRPEPDPNAPWIVHVAAELETLTSTVADHGIVIETAVPDVGQDTITLTLFDLRRRIHRTHDTRAISQIYTQGFEPPLTPLDAARLIALDAATPP